MNRKQRNAGYGGWLLSAAALSLLLLAAFAFAAPAFEIYPDKDSYYPNQDVYLVVSGPGDSGFMVQVLNPAGVVVSEKSSRTTSSGNSYLSYSGFSSEGVYSVRLIVGDSVVAISSFVVAKPGSVVTTTNSPAFTTTTATTGAVTTFTVTTSFISPTTPTTTVVTTGGGGEASSPPDPVPTTLPDYGGLPAIVERVEFDGNRPMPARVRWGGLSIVDSPAGVRRCSDGRCVLTAGSGGARFIDSGGRGLNFTDVVSFDWGMDRFRLSWFNRSADIGVFFVYGGRRYSAEEVRALFPSVQISGFVRDDAESYKYALNVSGIPAQLADGLAYVGFELKPVSGIGRQPTRRKGFLVLNDELAFGFSDLLRSNFTVSFVNDSTVLVGGVRNKTSLFLDPVIQLQTADTRNLEDTWVWSNAADTNYGGDATMLLQDRTTRMGRIHIKFNTSAVPSSVTVRDARLCLYLSTDGNTLSGSVYHVKDHTWDGRSEADLTWNNQVCGTLFNDAADCNLTAESTQATTAVGWVCWNVTKMFNVEYSAGHNNLSIVVRSPEANTLTADQFCTKEGAAAPCNTAQRPYLNVTYTDGTTPKYSNILQSPSGNPTYGYAVQCNATWTDNVALSTVYFRSNYSGSWQNYTASNSGSVYYYSIPSSQLPAGKRVGWNYWANDTANNWNKSMSTQSFIVQKATPTMMLLLNGTNGDKEYMRNTSANLTAVLSVSGKTVEIWANFSGAMARRATGASPLTNITKLNYPYGRYLVKANFSGDVNYTAASTSHNLTITTDPFDPVITAVSPINLTYGIGYLVTIRANVTDNMELDTVRLNITPPGGAAEIHVMTNSTPAIFTYTFRVWKPGDYYYKIIANDTTGNTVVYHPYVYVRGSGFVSVVTENDTYGLNSDVNLTSASSVSSTDLESGTATKKGINAPVYGNTRGMLAYGESGVNTPTYRVWNTTSSSWTSAASAVTIGTPPEYLRVLCSNLRDECALLTTDTLEDVNIQFRSRILDTLCWNNGSACNQVMEVETATPAIAGVKQADMAYMNLSGKLLIVWAGNLGAELEYRVWNGTAFSSEGSFTFTAAIGTIEWIDLESEPGTEQIVVAAAGANDQGAIVMWNGTAFDPSCEYGAVLGLAASDRQKVDCAFEQLSGDLFCAFGIDPTTEFDYVTKPFGSCSYTAAQTTNQNEQSNFIDVSPAQGSDLILISHIADTNNDMEAVAWNGSAISANLWTDTSIEAEQTGDYRVDTACIYSADICRLVYSDDAGTSLDQAFYVPSTDSWFTPADWAPTPAFSDLKEAIRCYPYPASAKIICVLEDNSDDLWAKVYNATGAGWFNTEGGAALDSTTSVAGVINFDFDWLKVITSSFNNDSATNYTTYSDVMASGVSNAKAIRVTVYVSYYNKTASTLRGNNAPTLQLELYNGSAWIAVGIFPNVSGTGNFSIASSNASVLSAWATVANTDLRIRGVNFDYINYSKYDQIRWTGVWAKAYNGSALVNTGTTNISGYLLMTVEKNSTGTWTHVATVVNDTSTSTTRNLTGGSYLNLASVWNPVHWNTASNPSGYYRVHASFLASNGSILTGSDGRRMEGTDVFDITVFGSISATPQTVGYGQKVRIAAEALDPTTDDVYVYVARPGEGYASYLMTKGAGSVYYYNYSNTWRWGNYTYYIWSNNSAGAISTSDTYLFYVRANASIGVQTVNDSYGPNEDVNIVASSLFSPVWLDPAWGYRKVINITNVGTSALTNFPAYVNVSFATGMQSDYDDLRFFINSTALDYEIENYTSTNAHVWLRVPTLAVGKTTIYMYYGNPTASSGEDPEAVWDSSFRGVWHLAESGTNPRLDSTGLHNNLTPNSGVSHITAKVDGADDFDGANDYSETVSNMGITGNTPRTISFWLRLDDTARCGIIGWGQDGDSQHYEVAVRTGHWFLWGWGGGNDWNTAVVPVTGVWMYHTIIFDGTTVSWYVNGTSLGTFTHTYNTADTHMYMAIEDDIGVITYMNGAIDEVQISNVSRSLGWLNQTRQLVEKQSTFVSFGAAQEYETESRLTNLGSTNISGYLEMRVQRYSGGTWVSFEAPFVNDRLPPQITRNISVGEILALDSIWNPAGWNTSLNPGGLYRAYVRLVSPLGNPLVNDDGSAIAGWYNFTIVSSYMQLTGIEHENNVTASLNEYETGDNIAWINITAINRNASAVNASITLNVLNSAKTSKIAWGPQTETTYCGNLAVNASCEQHFDNSSSGYSIPTNATAGGYRFYWNVTMASKSGITKNNNSLYFRLHNVPDNTTSTLSPTKIFQNKSAIYNFTLTNPWSKNLTALSVTINCPTVAGLTCRCLGTALTYCNISALAAGAARTFRFNISTNSTPAGDYTINATLNYTNPGLEKHSWPALRSQVLRVRIPGQFVIISTAPANMTRSGYGILKGYSNNTLGSAMHNVTLNWTLPSGWTNSSGSLGVFDSTQDADEILWNNITAYAATTALLGPQTVELRSSSAEGYEDWDTRSITVYAQTYIKSLHPNSTDPSRGDTVILIGQLTLDNGTIQANKNVSMYDVTAGVSMGWDLTDNLGWFYIPYVIPSSAALGNHTLNATFPGQLASYYLKSWNKTWMRVHDKPLIQNVLDSPDPQGYSYTVTLRANVTDLEGVSRVRVCITPPSSSQTCYTMTNYSANIYTYNYSNTWTWGNYSYYIWANDSAGKISQSSTYYFHIRANATIQIFTVESSYGPMETVNLTACSSGSWTDTFTDSTRVNSSASSNYNVAGGEVQLAAASYTKVYDFASCTGGTTCWAWDVETDAVPPEGAPNAETAAASGNYDSIAVSGGTRWALADPGIGDYEWIRSQMRIVENRSKITRINFTGEGYSSATSNTRIYVCNLTDNGVALPNCDSWILVVEQQVTQNPPDTTVRGSLTSGFSDIVSSTGYIYWVWGLTGVDNEYLSVDYVKLDVTYSGYAPSGYVTSTAVTPANLASWVKTQASDSLPSSTSMNFSVLNAADNSVLCTMTSAQAVAGFNISSCAADAVSLKLRANMATTNMSKTPRLYSWNLSWKNGSCIANLGFTNITGYLLLKVQHYTGGAWVDVASNNPVVNDTTARAFSRLSSTSLNPIWNGVGEGDGWNTAKESIGQYRVYAALRDPSGNMLKNDDGSYVYDTYNFNITNPDYIIQLQQIRLYDVTAAASKKTDKTYLMGGGLNTTFTLFTNKTYRAEVVVWNNASSTEAWTVSSSDVIFHSGLNSTWEVNASENIWYANSTKNMTGGSWSGGKIAWNTSKGGTLGVGQNMTFYYIFNITSNSSKNYPVHFMLNDTLFTREDSSIYSIVMSEEQPPRLFNLIYDVTRDTIHRNQSLVVYARWNEAIAQALAEYNSTSSTLLNHTITLPVPNPYYWTNHTIAANTSWKLGAHNTKIYAADLNSNWNTTLWYLPFSVWGWSSVPSSALSSYTITNGSSVTMRCRVTSDNGSALANYNVSFYNSTGLLGSNLTNSTGWARFTFRDYSLGYETIKCNITNNTAIYHHITANNYGTQTLRTIETTPPWYVNATQNTSKVHRGERISLSAYWYDNAWLNYGWLESNQTGTFQNNSLASRQLLNVSQMRVYFNVTMPTTSRLGRMGWRIWVNDTSSNINKTNPRNYTYVWGYAIVNASSLSPNPIYVNNYTTMRCRVVDYNNGSAISNYNVSFYSNESGYMGSNLTNGTGWAKWRFNDTTEGFEQITCNISSYAAKYYDPGTPSSASQVLRAAAIGSDTTAPGTMVYALNDTAVIKGQRLKIYGKWTENITAAVVRFNSTSSTVQQYTPDTVSGQWTNHTITTNSSWIVGVHYAKLNASDVWGNWNNTLAYLTFKVYGRSKVAWYSPTTTQYRGVIPLRCRVYDKDNNVGIGSYSVNFYNSSWDYLGTAATNSSGIATYSWNATAEPVGTKASYCTIVSSGYYNTTAADDDATGSFDLYGRLNVTIDAPANKSSYYKGKTVTLNSTTRDELKVVVTPDTARWYDGATQIAATQDASWAIPVAHSTGSTTIIINVTKSYYSLSRKNVTIYVWGYSNVTWISPVGGNFSAGSTVSLICRVRDVNSSSGILNYPVRFYYKNSTESTYHYLGVRAANSTGYATIDWATAGLPAGNYTARCNITNNATLYYNATAKKSGNTTINLTGATAGRLEVHLMLPPTLPGDGSATYSGGYQVGRNRTFILKANVTCRNIACGNVQGTVRYNVTANPDTALGTVYATPFYVAGTLPTNPTSCSGNPLAVNESCVMNWTINATGALGSVWKLDVLFDGASAVSNQTNYTQVRITKVLILHLSTNDIDWGIRDPQTTCNPGVANGSFVNISLDANSNDADGVYLRGSDMVNGSYSIGVGNVTWAKVNLCTNGYNLNATWAKVRNFTKSGKSQQTYFWVDIPAVPAKRYHGYAYVMANTTSSG